MLSTLLDNIFIHVHVPPTVWSSGVQGLSCKLRQGLNLHACCHANFMVALRTDFHLLPENYVIRSNQKWSESPNISRISSLLCVWASLDLWVLCPGSAHVSTQTADSAPSPVNPGWATAWCISLEPPGWCTTYNAMSLKHNVHMV